MSAITYDDPENPPLHYSLSTAHVRARDAAEHSAGIAGARGEETLAARPVEGPAAAGQGAEFPEAGKLGGNGGAKADRAELPAAEIGAALAVRGAGGGRGTRSRKGTGGGRKRRRRIAVARTALGCACALLALLGVALLARRGEDGGISGAWRAADPLLVRPPLEPSPLLRGLGSFAPETDGAWYGVWHGWMVWHGKGAWYGVWHGWMVWHGKGAWYGVWHGCMDMHGMAHDACGLQSGPEPHQW
ncbi:unnamed protein product [Closterium sp. Yama58-4]|nr:unnamed protein product [Closterium sp. Yama58-4]